MAFTTFDPTSAVNATVSNGNLTIAGTSSVSSGGAQSVDGHLSGKYYFEVTLDQISSGFTMVGIANPSATVPIAGNITNGFGIISSGTLYLNGQTLSVSIGTPAAGAVVCFAIDLDNLRGFVRLGASGNWNGNSAKTPNTPSTGIDLSSVFGVINAAHPFANAGLTTGQVTANFGASTFTGTVPTGYTSGWTSPGDPVEAVVTATGAEVWASGTPSMQVTTAGAEVWGAPTNAPVFLSQLNAEAWLTGNPAVNLSSQQLEVWFSLIPAAVLSAAHMEVWFDQKSLPSSSRPNYVVVT